MIGLRHWQMNAVVARCAYQPCSAGYCVKNILTISFLAGIAFPGMEVSLDMEDRSALGFSERVCRSTRTNTFRQTAGGVAL